MPGSLPTADEGHGRVSPPVCLWEEREYEGRKGAIKRRELDLTQVLKEKKKNQDYRASHAESNSEKKNW